MYTIFQAVAHVHVNLWEEQQQIQSYYGQAAIW